MNTSEILLKNQNIITIPQASMALYLGIYISLSSWDFVRPWSDGKELMQNIDDPVPATVFYVLRSSPKIQTKPLSYIS